MKLTKVEKGDVESVKDGSSSTKDTDSPSSKSSTSKLSSKSANKASFYIDKGTNIIEVPGKMKCDPNWLYFPHCTRWLVETKCSCKLSKSCI